MTTPMATRQPEAHDGTIAHGGEPHVPRTPEEAAKAFRLGAQLLRTLDRLMEEQAMEQPKAKTTEKAKHKLTPRK